MVFCWLSKGSHRRRRRCAAVAPSLPFGYVRHSPAESKTFRFLHFVHRIRAVRSSRVCRCVCVWESVLALHARSHALLFGCRLQCTKTDGTDGVFLVDCFPSLYLFRGCFVVSLSWTKRSDFFFGLHSAHIRRRRRCCKYTKLRPRIHTKNVQFSLRSIFVPIAPDDARAFVCVKMCVACVRAGFRGYTTFEIHLIRICDCFECGSANIASTIRTLRNHLEYISFTFSLLSLCHCCRRCCCRRHTSTLLLLLPLVANFLSVLCIARAPTLYAVCMCYIAKAIRIFCNLRACLSLNRFPHAISVRIFASCESIVCVCACSAWACMCVAKREWVGSLE